MFERSLSFCSNICVITEKRSSPLRWLSCPHRRDQICSRCPSLSSSGHPWSCQGFQSRCPSHCPQTESEEKQISSHTLTLHVLSTVCTVLVCLSAALFACLEHTTCLFVILSAFPASCEGTSPCLCGLITFWHLLSTSFLGPTNKISPAKAAQSLLLQCCNNSHRPPTGWQTHTHSAQSIHLVHICVFERFTCP